MSKKIKVDLFASMDEFSESKTAGEYDRVTVIRENGWIKCDLVTGCKNGKTAVNRLFKALENNGIYDVSDWHDCMLECIESGFYKLNDGTMADGSKNPLPSYYWEVEFLDDSLVYVFINKRVEEPATVTAQEPATVTAQEPATVTAQEPATVTAQEPATVTGKFKNFLLTKVENGSRVPYVLKAVKAKDIYFAFRDDPSAWWSQVDKKTLATVHFEVITVGPAPVEFKPVTAGKDPETGYYNKAIRERFLRAFFHYETLVKAGVEFHVTISARNNKMGEVASVSTLPFVTCPACCHDTCGRDCYAAKICNLRFSVLNAYAKNTALAMLKPDQFWAEVMAYMETVSWFRFHVSGDIINDDYFARLVAACIACHNTRILSFTKKWDIVNRWLDSNGDLPGNFQQMMSSWPGLEPVNPHHLPETNIYTSAADFVPTWKTCGGNCFNCGCRGVGCWNAVKGDVVAFKLH